MKVSGSKSIQNAVLSSKKSRNQGIFSPKEPKVAVSFLDKIQNKISQTTASVGSGDAEMPTSDSLARPNLNMKTMQIVENTDAGHRKFNTKSSLSFVDKTHLYRTMDENLELKKEEKSEILRAEVNNGGRQEGSARSGHIGEIDTSMHSQPYLNSGNLLKQRSPYSKALKLHKDKSIIKYRQALLHANQTNSNNPTMHSVHGTSTIGEHSEAKTLYIARNSIVSTVNPLSHNNIYKTAKAVASRRNSHLRQMSSKPAFKLP